MNSIQEIASRVQAVSLARYPEIKKVVDWTFPDMLDDVIALLNKVPSNFNHVYNTTNDDDVIEISLTPVSVPQDKMKLRELAGEVQQKLASTFRVGFQVTDDNPDYVLETESSVIPLKTGFAQIRVQVYKYELVVSCLFSKRKSIWSK